MRRRPELTTAKIPPPETAPPLLPLPPTADAVFSVTELSTTSSDAADEEEPAARAAPPWLPGAPFALTVLWVTETRCSARSALTDAIPAPTPVPIDVAVADRQVAEVDFAGADDPDHTRKLPPARIDRVGRARGRRSSRSFHFQRCAGQRVGAGRQDDRLRPAGRVATASRSEPGPLSFVLATVIVAWAARPAQAAASPVTESEIATLARIPGSFAWALPKSQSSLTLDRDARDWGSRSGSRRPTRCAGSRGRGCRPRP